MVAGLLLALVASCSSPAPERTPAAGDGSGAGSQADDRGEGSAGESLDGSGSGSGQPPLSVPLQDPEAFDGPPLDDDEVAARLSDLGGQLAIGRGPAVAVARPDGGALRVLGREDEQAAQPTWSRDGAALAWSSASADRQVVLVQRFDDGGRPTDDPEVSDAAGFPVFYLQWDRDDRHLAYLRTAVETGQVEFGLLEPGLPLQPVDEAVPFFVGWAPGSPRLLAHAGEEVLRLHEVADGVDPPGAGEVVLDRGGGYTAPAWVDDGRAVVVDEGSLAIVTVADGTVESIEPVSGPVAFALSPDGSRLAYRLLPETGGDVDEASLATGSVAENQLVVLDLATGEREVVTDEGAVAWEWSPDGSRLAWLTFVEGAVLSGRWHFWSVDGSAPGTDRTPDFALTRTYAQSYLPFFAQYAQSVTGWAPDSSAFAYAGTVGSGQGVWVQLVDEPAPSRLVAPGDFVTWGTGPTPDDSAGASAA